MNSYDLLAALLLADDPEDAKPERVTTRVTTYDPVARRARAEKLERDMGLSKAAPTPPGRSGVRTRVA